MAVGAGLIEDPWPRHAQNERAIALRAIATGPAVHGPHDLRQRSFVVRHAVQPQDTAIALNWLTLGPFGLEFLGGGRRRRRGVHRSDPGGLGSRKRVVRRPGEGVLHVPGTGGVDGRERSHFCVEFRF